MTLTKTVNLKSFSMFSIESLYCLKLNKNWQGIGVDGIEKAIGGIFSGSYLAMDINYPLVNGEYDFNNPSYEPVDWNKWIKLPVRSFDYSISSPTNIIRIPTVILSRTYSNIPLYHARLTKKAILERDNFICQYTGRKLSKDEANVDHLIPVSRNGKNSWENLVTCDKKINSFKGNKTLEECNLKLIKKPRKPSPYPIVSKIDNKHRDWKWFLLNHV